MKAKHLSKMVNDYKLKELTIAVGDVDVFIGTVKGLISGDINAENLTDARSELANASNAIDDAMGIIDELMAPEPTVWDDPHLP